MKREKIEFFKDKDTALRRAQHLTKKNRESFMAYEFPNNNVFAVLRTEYFKRETEKEGYTMEKFGEMYFDKGQWKIKARLNSLLNTLF